KALLSGAGHNPKFKIEILRRLSGCYSAQGKFSQADALMKEVIALQESNPSPDEISRFRTYAALGDIEQHRKDYDKAVAFYKKADNLYSYNSSVDPSEHVSDLLQMAVCYYYGGKLADFDSTFKRVMRLDEASPSLARIKLGSDTRVYTELLKKQGRADLAAERQARTAE